MDTKVVRWWAKLGLRVLLLVLAAVFTLFGVAGIGFAAYALVTRASGFGGVVEYGIPLGAFVLYTYLVGSYFVNLVTGDWSVTYRPENADGISPVIWRGDGLFTKFDDE